MLDRPVSMTELSALEWFELHKQVCYLFLSKIHIGYSDKE